MRQRAYLAASLLVASLLFAWWAFRDWQVRTWQPIPAEVVGGRTETIVHPPRQSRYRGPTPPRREDVRYAVYAYFVDGERYLGEWASGRSEGMKITVYYDPDHPERSAAEKPEVSRPSLVAATLLFAGGVGLGWSVRKKG